MNLKKDDIISVVIPACLESFLKTNAQGPERKIPNKSE
jgi:hypothetical protein